MELSLDIIYDSEPEQAAAHVLAYFRQEFAKPFPPPKPLSPAQTPFTRGKSPD